MKLILPLLLLAGMTYGQDKEYVINFTQGTTHRHNWTYDTSAP